jgi:hypothetical protein
MAAVCDTITLMSDTAAKTRSCRVCGLKNLTPVFSLGELCVSNFVDGPESPANKEKFPLELMLCNVSDGGCGLLQLNETVSHEAMYRNYWYRSGINKTMTDELNGIAHIMENMANVHAGDYVLDIGTNDGTLLRAYSDPGLQRIGFEPANNLGQYNSKGTTKVFNDFFSAARWEKEFADAHAKSITAIAMFYDLEDPNSFVSDVAKILDPHGVFVIQQSYLPLMLATNEIGNICHEHLEYYSLLALENLLKRHNLEVFDVVLNDINGGSFRTYIRHTGAKIPGMRAGAAERLQDLRDSEIALGLNSRAPYDDFNKRVNAIRDTLKAFLKNEKAKGKKIYGYGASTKGNTLLQYFELGPDLIDVIAERNPDKWGKKTVGTLIPIISEEQARSEKPDYFLVLPWHFFPEFKEREREYLKGGGKFILPMPEFRIVGDEE